MDKYIKNTKKCLITMGVICFLSVILLVVLLIVKSNRSEYVKPKFDKCAVIGTPNVDRKEYSEVDIDKGYRVGLCAKIEINSENEGYILFSSDKDNIVYVKLKITDLSGAVLAETGLIKSGEYIEKIKLNRDIKDGENVIIKVMGYDPKTYYSMGVAKFNSILKEGGN